MAAESWNIFDLIAESGEETIQEMISYFSCDKIVDGKAKNLNPDIEYFLINPSDLLRLIG